MIKREKLAELFDLTQSEIEEIEEACTVYKSDKNNQSYTDWCKMYDGIHHESTFEAAFRNWLACIRWMRSKNKVSFDEFNDGIRQIS